MAAQDAWPEVVAHPRLACCSRPILPADFGLLSALVLRHCLCRAESPSGRNLSESAVQHVILGLFCTEYALDHSSVSACIPVKQPGCPSAWSAAITRTCLLGDERCHSHTGCGFAVHLWNGAFHAERCQTISLAGICHPSFTANAPDWVALPVVCWSGAWRLLCGQEGNSACWGANLPSVCPTAPGRYLFLLF